MKKYSAEWIEEQVLGHGYTKLLVHNCALCGYPCGYRFSSAHGVEYDHGCWCNSVNIVTTNGSFQHIADLFAIQGSDEIRERMAARFSK